MATERVSLARLWALMATVFVDMMGFLMVLPVLPFYAVRLGASPFVIGLMVSVFALAQLLVLRLDLGRRFTVVAMPGNVMIFCRRDDVDAIVSRAAAHLEPGGMLVAGFSASLGFALPVATPPNAIVFGSGEVPMRQMVKAGLIIDVVGIIVVAVLLSFLAPLVLS